MPVAMTNLMLVIPNISSAPQTEFFRAYRLNADPPQLQAFLAGKSPSLMVFGLTGTNYTLQVTSNLSDTIAWYPLLSYTMTNAFQSITNLAASTNAAIFYRIQKN